MTALGNDSFGRRLARPIGENGRKLAPKRRQFGERREGERERGRTAASSQHCVTAAIGLRTDDGAMDHHGHSSPVGGLASANQTPRRQTAGAASAFPSAKRGTLTPLGGLQQALAPASSTPTTPSNLLETFRKSTGGTSTGLKEHERLMDELKKENFDLKLKCYHFEDQLRKTTPTNVAAVFAENDQLRAATEAAAIEVRSLKGLLEEAQRFQSDRMRSAAMTGEQEAEIVRLRSELDLVDGQLTRTLNQVKNYEHQLEIFDNESRETLRRTKQLEVDHAAANKKLSEARATIEEQKREIAELNDELAAKNAFVQSVKSDSQAVHAELEMVMRQKQDLEGRLRIAENERDMAAAERDPARAARRRTTALLASGGAEEGAASPLRRLNNDMAIDGSGLRRGGPDSPRSSFDALESKLLRQIGATSKHLEVLSKSNTLSQSEKEALFDQSRALVLEINESVVAIGSIYDLIVAKTGITVESSTGYNNHLYQNENGSAAPPVTLTTAINQLARICEALITDYSAAAANVGQLEGELKRSHDQLALIAHQGERLREQHRTAIEDLSSTKGQLDATREHLHKSQAECHSLSTSLRSVTEGDLARYREQCTDLAAAIRTMEGELAARDDRLAASRREVEGLQRHLATLEGQAARAGEEAHAQRQEAATLRKQHGDLLAKLADQEALANTLAASLDEARLALAQVERIKGAVEENFNKELRALHTSNADLKAQLASWTSGKSSNDQRLERLQASLRFVEATKEEALAKLAQREAALSALQRDHEVALIEKKNVERDLVEMQREHGEREAEIARLRRLDAGQRRSADGVEHLAGKIESLTSLNAFLREQVEAKDRALRESEDKVRRQQDDIRRAYADCDAQHSKMKKRELIISRVLKRLENINAISGFEGILAEETSAAGAAGGRDAPPPHTGRRPGGESPSKRASHRF